MWNQLYNVTPSDDVVASSRDRCRQSGFRTTVDDDATNAHHRRMMMALMSSSSWPGRRHNVDGTDGRDALESSLQRGRHSRRETADTHVTSSSPRGPSPSTSGRGDLHQPHQNSFLEMFEYGFPSSSTPVSLRSLPALRPTTGHEATTAVQCRPAAAEIDFRSKSAVIEVACSSRQRVVVDDNDDVTTDRRRRHHQYVTNYSRRSPQSPVSDASTSGK